VSAEHSRDGPVKGRKSAGLSFGSFGFRKSGKITVEKTTLGLLKKRELDGYIRAKEEPDKEAVAAVDGAARAQADAARKIKGVFLRGANRETADREPLTERIAQQRSERAGRALP
jgi:phage host-nuclease inhibitor protein Gam